MSFFDKISIPSGTSVGDKPVSSNEDEPPASEQSTRGDDLNAQKSADAKSYRELREKFAEKAYKVAKYGLVWWACILLLSAVGKCVGKEVFSDKVIIAVTTASTVNLLAAFLGVIRGLFPTGKSNRD